MLTPGVTSRFMTPLESDASAVVLPAVRPGAEVPGVSAHSSPELSKPVKTLVTLATYNELENIPTLVDQLLASDPSLDLLVIDDNSPDGTGTWCEAKSILEPRLQCLHRAGKQGLGSATIAGMRHAIAERYDWVLNLDADFSHHPRFIPSLLAAREQADVVVGSRYVAGGGVQGWPWKRHWMSRAVNFYARTLLGLPLRDCSGAFRLYRVKLLERLDFGSMLAMGYAFQEEVLWRLKQVGARFVEVPIVFEDRRYGTSKINAKEARLALQIIARLGLKNWLGI